MLRTERDERLYDELAIWLPADDKRLVKGAQLKLAGDDQLWTISYKFSLVAESALRRQYTIAS